MLFYIGQLNREVELDDELAKIYTEYQELSESLFVLQLYYKFRDEYKNLNDEQLSLACNKILIDDLRNMKDFAIAIQYLNCHQKQLEELGWQNTPMEVSVE